MINVLRFTDDAMYMVIDALDEAEASFAASYDDWLADGGDPRDHPYYRISQANSAFGHAVVNAIDEETP
jgi:hypothetical protein